MKMISTSACTTCHTYYRGPLNRHLKTKGCLAFGKVWKRPRYVPSAEVKRKSGMSSLDILRLSAAALVDQRTIRKFLVGIRVRPMSETRIREAMTAARWALSGPQNPQNPQNQGKP